MSRLPRIIRSETSGESPPSFPSWREYVENEPAPERVGSRKPTVENAFHRDAQLGKPGPGVENEGIFEEILGQREALRRARTEHPPRPMLKPHERILTLNEREKALARSEAALAEREAALADAEEQIHVARKQAERLALEAEREREDSQSRRETARAEADAVLSDAAKEAEDLMESARRKTEEIEAQAYQAGFEQGEEAGRRLSEQKMDSIVRSLRGVIEKTGAERSAALRAAEEDLVRIACLAALRVLKRELTTDPGVVLDVVRDTIARAEGASRLTLRVSPQDFKFIEGRLDVLTRDLEDGTKLTVDPDPTVGRGGCRLLTDSGELDATIESMVEAIRSRIWIEEE